MKIKSLLLVSAFLCSFVALPAVAQIKIITTYAGTGTGSYTGDGGPASAATINQPNMICFDGSGNLLIADNSNNRVRAINLATGIISLVAGGGTTGTGGDGSAASATTVQFGAGGFGNAGLSGLAVDAAGNIYISDGTNNKIRVVTASTGIISTFAGTGTAGATGDGSPASGAQLNSPRGLAIDGSGNLYIADANNNKVRKIVLSTGIITTVAGTGTAGSTGDGTAATGALLNSPRSVCTDAAGNVYIADRSNNKVRKINVSTGIITTYVGSGTGGFAGDGGAAATAQINRPSDVKMDAAGNLYIADNSNTRVRMVTAAGIISTVAGASGFGGAAGDGGLATAAAVRVSPLSIAVIDSNHFYIADQTNNRIRYVKPDSKPYFTGGSNQTLTVCQNTIGDSINALMAVMDSDRLQTLTWSLSNAPAHGTLGSSATAATTGGVVNPVGLYYTPTSGYTGSDLFVIQVTDGYIPAFDTVYVTVNPLPNAGSISGPAAVCTGSSVTLTDAATGGAWSATNASASVLGGTVTGVAAGLDTINYSVTNTCGSATAVATVNVIAAPGPITGNFSVCVGLTSLLGNTTSGGTWTSTVPAVANIGSSSGLATGVTTGFSNISYTTGGLCTVTQVVTVNTVPAAITPAGAVSICVGATTSLGDATSGGIWSSAAPGTATVGTSGIVTGVAAGTVNISYTSAAGCASIKPVTVLPTPAALSPSSATVCTGNSVVFTESVAGGTWSSTAVGVASVVSGTVTGVAAGTANISYTIGTCAVGAPVTVNTSPAAITPAGAVSFCVGATASLSDGTPAGTWSSAVPGIATVGTSGTVTGVSAGAVNISYSNALGCAAVKQVTVLVTPAALAPVSAAVCVSSTATFTETVAGGVWTSNSPATATVAAGVVTGVSTGTTSISYTIGTCAVGAPVTVNPLPNAGSIVGPSSVCTGTPVTYTDAAGGGIWSSSNPAVASVGTSGIVTGSTPGTITLSYAVTNSCGTATATKSVSVGLAPNAGSITGLSTICAGTFTTLVDTVSGGVWSATNGDATISGGGLLVGVTPGTDTIKYSISNACGTVSALKVVTIGPFLSAGAISGTSGVCAGASVVLTDPAPSGTWSSSNASASVTGGTVTGIAAGTDTILYTVTASCGSAVAQKVINVIPVPAAGTISGPFVVCAGSITTYTDASSGGVWGVTNPLATISGAGVFSALTPGADTITYTISNVCGSASTQAAVSIGPAISPGSISGPGTVCAGSSVSLSETVPGGTWSVTNGHATILSGTLTGVSAGIDTVIYTVTGSCGTVTASAVVIINPLPVAGTVSGPSTLCMGSTATFTDPAPGGAWALSNGTATVTTGGVVTPVAAGNDTLGYTVTNGCGSAVATAVITIFNIPDAGTISGPSNVCTGSSVTLTDGVGGGTWSASNANATVSGGIVTGITAGTDTIVYTITSTCGSASTSAVIHVVAPGDPGVISGPSGLCIGSLATLTETVTGGAWSASNPIATISVAGVVTGITPGTDTINYTVTNACGSFSATHLITVSAMPFAGTISGPSVVCTGGTVTLTDPVTGGAWSSSNATASVSGGIVTGLAPGTDTISYTVTNGCGTATTSRIVAVGAALAAGSISGPSGVCIGGTVTLTDTVAGGVWSTVNAHASVAAGVVTGLSTGTDTVLYTVTGSCGSVSASKIITISIAPNAGIISGPSSVCAGAAITLSETVSGGIWTASNGKASVSVAGTVTGVLAGLDTIRYSVSNSCGTAVANWLVSINSSPSAGSISGTASLCPGSSVTLLHTVSGGTWTSSNNAVAIVSGTGMVSGVSSGSVVISYTVSNSCGHSSAVFPMTVLTSTTCGGLHVAGTNAASSESFVVAPNPNQGRFTVTFFSGTGEPVHIVISNVIGKKMKEFDTVADSPTEIGLNEPAGIYLISAVTTHGTYVARMIIN